MAQMKLLEKQKLKAEVEIETLEKLKVEMRTMIQRSFNASVLTLVSEMKGNIKTQIIASLRPMMQEELKQTMSAFQNDLASCVGENVRKTVSAEVEKIQIAGGGSIRTVVAETGTPRTDTAPSSDPLPGRAVMRGNISHKRGVKKMLTLKRKSIAGDNKPPGDPLREVESDAMPLIEKTESTQHRNSDVPKHEHFLVVPRNNLPGESEAGDIEGSSLLQRIITSDKFEQFMAVVIVVSSIIVGIQADYLSQTLDQDKMPAIFAWLDFATLILFSLEVGARIVVDGRRFFSNSDDLFWNLFDLVIVVSQIVDTLLTLSTTINGSKSIKALRVVRVARVLRLLRLARLIRLMRIILELRVIVSTFIGTLRSLIGAMGVFVLVMYLAGIYLTEQVASARQELRENGSELDASSSVVENFGSLAATMMTLFQSSTSGLIWGEAMESLGVYAAGTVPVFCVYVGFVGFAMVNVITGMFVKQSMEVAMDAQDDAMVSQINALYGQGVDSFTYEEYMTAMKSSEMGWLFKAMNVDPSECGVLFRLLDENGDGKLDYEEFVNGALRLRGPAKSLELALFTKETASVSRWTTSKLKNVESKLAQVARSHDESLRKVLELHDMFRSGQAGIPELSEVEAEQILSQLGSNIDPEETAEVAEAAPIAS
eukprot:TRINITY_DN44523_c0_g1_i1.p1 TRINITY_DN44523_c0_g1~~TRINITY_DN44523_c0_g1_i1.p1  ORF type:complete len:680 (+),score=120.60 TRINITY_DN44523_c0_g1_i1:75-2042(+)